jgi:hypothetical protein
LRLSALALSAVSASGCAPFRYDSRFDAVGEYRAPSQVSPIVPSADAVKVYYASAPPGFSLRENELKVETGYKHQILEMVLSKGGGTWGIGETPKKSTVMRELQKCAYEQGGNAVIYADSRIGEATSAWTMPREVAETNKFGSGWIVVLQK